MPRPAELLDLFFAQLEDPIQQRLMKWLIASERPAAAHAFALRDCGLQLIAQRVAAALVPDASREALEVIELALLTAVAAAYGYVLTEAGARRRARPADVRGARRRPAPDARGHVRGLPARAARADSVVIPVACEIRDKLAKDRARPGATWQPMRLLVCSPNWRTVGGAVRSVVSWAGLPVALALSGARTVHAAPCAPSAALGGDADAVAQVGAELARLGDAIARDAAQAAASGCRFVVAAVAREPGGAISVAVHDGARSEDRRLSDASLAAEWIDSWLHDAVLAPPALVPARDVDDSPHAPAALHATAPAPRGDRVLISASGLDTLAGGSWLGASGGACVRPVPSASARGSATRSRTSTSARPARRARICSRSRPRAGRTRSVMP